MLSSQKNVKDNKVVFRETTESKGEQTELEILAPKLEEIIAKNTDRFKGNILSFPSFFNSNEKWPGCLPRPLY
jgi:CRISPR/Cas system-associated endonuclease Cas3-HD